MDPKFLAELQQLDGYCADALIAAQAVSVAEKRRDSSLAELNSVVHQLMIRRHRWVPVLEVQVAPGHIYLLRLTDGRQTQLRIARWWNGWRTLWIDKNPSVAGELEVLLPE